MTRAAALIGLVLLGLLAASYAWAGPYCIPEPGQSKCEAPAIPNPPDSGPVASPS